VARLIRIGNSLGVRLPKPIIEHAGLSDKELEVRVVEEGVLLTPVRKARQDWQEQFEAMRAAGEDAPLLDESASNAFDDAEWIW